MSYQFSKGAQVRRGLASALNLMTKLSLERQARKQQEQARQGQDSLRSALELSRRGDVGAREVLAGRAGLAGYQPDKDEASRLLAQRLFEPALRQKQYGIAQELAQRMGIQTVPTPPPIAPQQQASIDLTRARISDIEQRRKIAEQTAAARIAHMKTLSTHTRARTDKITRDIQAGARAGKLDDKGLSQMRQSLSAAQRMLDQQFDALKKQPDFWQDETRTKVNPAYEQSLAEMQATYNYNNKLMAVIADFQARQALPTASIPQRPQTPQVGRMVKTPDGKQWEVTPDGNFKLIK